jgi:hypothetical protein
MDQNERNVFLQVFLIKVGHFGVLGRFKSSRFGLSIPLSLHIPAQISKQQDANGWPKSL